MTLQALYKQICDERTTEIAKKEKLAKFVAVAGKLKEDLDKYEMLMLQRMFLVESKLKIEHKDEVYFPPNQKKIEEAEEKEVIENESKPSTSKQIKEKTVRVNEVGRFEDAVGELTIEIKKTRSNS